MKLGDRATSLNRTKQAFLVAGLAGLASVLLAALSAEGYELEAGEPLIVQRSPNEAVTTEGALVVLKRGERLPVSACLDYKTDIAVELRVNNTDRGYVSSGDFRLLRIRWPLRTLLQTPDRLVWSCRNFYAHRKMDAD